MSATQSNPVLVPATAEQWAIVDRQTGQLMGKPYTNRRRAMTRADKLDQAYGAYRYAVRLVETK